MLDLQSAFTDFTPEIELAEPAIDPDFITGFLLPYFQHLPREVLEAELAEIISREQARTRSAPQPRCFARTVAGLS